MLLGFPASSACEETSVLSWEWGVTKLSYKASRHGFCRGETQTGGRHYRWDSLLEFYNSHFVSSQGAAESSVDQPPSSEADARRAKVSSPPSWVSPHSIHFHCQETGRSGPPTHQEGLRWGLPSDHYRDWRLYQGCELCHQPFVPQYHSITENFLFLPK